MSRNISAFVLVFLVASMFLVQFAAASDAVIAYASTTGSSNNPHLRFWNSSGTGSWDGEIQLASAGGPLRWLVIKQSPVSNKLVLVTQGDTNANIDAYVCMSDCTNPSNWVLSSNLDDVLTLNQRAFDVEFEASTGNAMLVYNGTNGTRDLAYRVLPAGSANFSSTTEQYIDDPDESGTTTYRWIRLDRNPAGGQELVLAANDQTNNEIAAFVWNGASWGNHLEVSDTATATGGYEALAVRYAADGSKAMVIGGNGTTGRADYAYWNGASWSAIGSFDVNGADNGGVEWLNLKARPAGVGMQMAAVTAHTAPDLYTAYWDGSSWNISNKIETLLSTDTARPVDFEWLPSGASGRLVWGTTTAGTLSQMACSPYCINGTDSTISAYAGTNAWLSLYRNPTPTDTVAILGVRMNSAPALGSFRFNGTNYTNYGDSNITGSPPSNAYEGYSVAFLAPVSVPGVVITLGSSPANNAIINYSPVNFTFTATSNASSTLNCALWIDGGFAPSGTATVTNNVLSGIVSEVTSGVHLWNVTCTDLVAQGNSSATRNFTADLAAPVVALNYPPNASMVSTTAFNFTAVDDASAIMNCSIWVDGSIRAYNENVPNNTMWSFGVGVSQGPHSWYILCKDQVNNIGVSENRTFTYDTIPPSIALGLPNNSAKQNTTTVVFSYTPTDNLATQMNCSLFVDSVWKGMFWVNNGTTDTESYSPFGSGAHTWNVACTDLAGNTNTSASRVFMIDQPPVVILNAPADGSWIISPGPANVTFTFTGVDDFGIPFGPVSVDSLGTVLNCKLYLDGTLNYTNAAVYNNTPVSVNFTVDLGTHSWSVVCTDGSNNTGISPTYWFTISESVQPPPSTGGGEELKHFTISAAQVCPGNKIDVYAYTSTGELTGADVREVLFDPYEGLISQDSTDSSGHVVFNAAGEGTYVLSATKTGYANPSDVSLQFTYCAGEAPPTGGNETQPPPTPPQPPAGTNVTPPVTPPVAPSNPSVGTHDQQAANGGVTIDSIDLDKPGCAVIYTVGPDGNPQTVVGYTDVMSGGNSNVDVALSGYGNLTDFVVMLYYDNGDGKCDPTTDQKVMVNGAPVLKEFRVTQPQAAAPKPPTTPPTTTPTPAASPCPVTLIIIGAVVLIALAAGAYMMFGNRPRASRK